VHGQPEQRQHHQPAQPRQRLGPLRLFLELGDFGLPARLEIRLQLERGRVVVAAV